jgi:hypothetical protein
MTHSEIQDLLEAYVDDALDRPTRKLVESHIAGCSECQAILDDVAEVDLSGLSGGVVNEKLLKRSVRKAMRRTIADAVLVLVAGWIIIWFVCAALLQPLVVNRSGRAASAARATIDTAIMLNPGITITDVQIDSNWLSRVVTAEVGMAVGTSTKPAGTIASRIGAFRFSGESGASFFPYINSDSSTTIDAPGLMRLGDATVATVQVWFDEPISLARAQQFADSAANDVRVIWAGFPTSVSSSDPSMAENFGNGVIGYGTCGASFPEDDFFGASSASFSGTGMFYPASIQNALDQVRRSLVNLAASPAISDAATFGPNGPEEVAAATNLLGTDDPGVASLVVTGPSVEIAGFLKEADIPFAALLGVDFYNWSTPICGR